MCHKIRLHSARLEHRTCIVYIWQLASVIVKSLRVSLPLASVRNCESKTIHVHISNIFQMFEHVKTCSVNEILLYISIYVYILDVKSGYRNFRIWHRIFFFGNKNIIFIIFFRSTSINLIKILDTILHCFLIHSLSS